MSRAGAGDGGGVLQPPAGMRDLLPPESRARRRVSEQIQGVLERHGYELVTTPLFERSEVFELAQGTDPRDLLRFVEPDGGEIAALRPDITPQIARVVCSQLTDHPAPYRLRYEGTVVRRRRGRARVQRQIAQVGVELIGPSGAAADAEVMRLALSAIEATGLRGTHLELSNVGVARSLLVAHGSELLERARDPIAHKDEARVRQILAAAAVPAETQQRITSLLALHGDRGVLREARALLAGHAEALSHLAEIEHAASELGRWGLGDRVGFDLGEIRGATYYTGVSFSVFAHGPGEAVLRGGRYDQLFARYGRDLPATGFAIDLENLLWSLDDAGHPWRRHPEVRLVLCTDDEAALAPLLGALRARAIAVASLRDQSPEQALAYARAWGYEAVLSSSAEGAISVTRSADQSQRALPLAPTDADITDLCRWAEATPGD